MTNGSPSSRLSPQFRARLERLGPRQRVRAIVLLRTDGGNGRRQTPTDRQAAIASVQSAALEALPEIDAILERHDGRRLAAPNALGSIPIETTADGIRALAECAQVQAILEDQSIALPAATASSSSAR